MNPEATGPAATPRPFASLNVPKPHELWPLDQWPTTDSLKLETSGVSAQISTSPTSLKNYLKAEAWQIKRDAMQLDLISKRQIWRESVLAKLIEAGAYDLAEPLQRCGRDQSWARCTGCRKIKTFFNRCDNFYCPSCQPMLSRKRFESLEWWTNTIAQPKHLVLTARNSKEITKKRVKWFKAQLKKLLRSVVTEEWRGGLWSLEVTNEGRGWHLHAHLLIDCDFVDMPRVTAKWAKLVGQDFAICKVKDARGKEYLREVTKYAVKGNELAKWSATDIVHFIWAFSGGKNFGVFGSLYGKRKQWSDWIKTQREKGDVCSCGCNKWEILDHDPRPLDAHVHAVTHGGRAP